MRGRRRWWLGATLGVVLVGLGVLTTFRFTDPEPLRSTFLNSGPEPPGRAVRAVFGARLEFLGYELDAVPVRPGESFTIRYHWRALQPMRSDYVFFVHFEGPGGARFQQDHEPQGGRHPTSRWTPREHVTEEFAVRVPPELPAGSYEIGLGAWDPRGSGARLRVAASSGVRNGNKVVVGMLPVASPLVERLPDGLSGRIAFQSNRAGAFFKIYVMDNRGVRRLTDGPGNDMKPAWSPDGRQIAFFSDRDGNNEIYVVDADGKNLRRLTFDPGDDKEPAWSPDGRRIVFASDRDGPLNLWMMNSDGSQQRRFTDYRLGKAAIPAWSPDGRWIAFTSSMRLGWRVSIIDSEGRQERVLANERGDCRPAWSPDGHTIAFVSLRSDGKGDIWLMGADGGDLRRVTTDPALYEYHPAWSPDARRLVFAAGADKSDYKLFVIDADGANRQQLTFGGSFDTHPTWIR